MITCWFYKKVITHQIDVNQTLPEKAQHHIQTCAACRQFYALECEVTRRLVADAERHRQSPSPFLHAKIMASIDRPTEITQPAPKFLHPIWATALVIIALGALTIPQLKKMQTASSQSTADSQTVAVRPTTNSITTTGPSLLAWSKALDRPLETEMQSVVSDAKTAVLLLAQNFLPEKSPEPNR